MLFLFSFQISPPCRRRLTAVGVAGIRSFSHVFNSVFIHGLRPATVIIQKVFLGKYGVVIRGKCASKSQVFYMNGTSSR